MCGNQGEEKRFWSGQSDENPPYFVGIAAVSFAPYATFLFSWDYAIIIADKSCLLPWHQINARGALKLAFPLQESSFHASCSGFNPLCIRSHTFCNFHFLFLHFTHTLQRIYIHLTSASISPRCTHACTCCSYYRS